jgi:DNA-binding LacI/PurR family transcriptional regulator
VDPPLTTARQPIDQMGRAAIDLLVAQIEGRLDDTDEYRFEPELVVRSSTGRARSADT